MVGGPFAKVLGKRVTRCFVGHAAVPFLHFGRQYISAECRFWRVELEGQVLSASSDDSASLAGLNGRILESAEICSVTGDTDLLFIGGAVFRSFVASTEQDSKWIVGPVPK